MDALPAIAVALAALVPAAVYASLINDATDLEADRAAGKRNRLAGRSATARIGALGGCILAGTAIAVLAWRDDALALLLYGGSWLSFTLYSCPPVRLKVRGLAGPLADAAGAHVFPQLLMVAAVTSGLGDPLDLGWVAIIAAWSGVHGTSSVLWHQLDDISGDARAGLSTFARAHPVTVRRTIRLLLPLELGLFAALALYAGIAAVTLLFVPYLFPALVRLRDHPASAQARFRLIVDEYYIAAYPAILLCAAALHDPQVWIVMLGHLTLFHGVLVRWVRDAPETARRVLYPIVIATRRRAS